MKISLFSAFYPFRGGIAQFNERLVEELDRSHQVNVYTFKKQYPNWLFPGTSQYVTNKDSKWSNRAKRIVSSFNPFTYLRGRSIIRNEDPELFIANYWMTIFAPFLAVFFNGLKGKSKRILLVHNLQPHEPRFFDDWLNKMILKKVEGVVVLSEEVKEQVEKCDPKVKVKLLYHPWYDHFPAKTERLSTRSQLGIPETSKVLLFFGLIRDYKGLDTLLEAFELLDTSYNLIIAGEFYGKREVYEKWLNDPQLKHRIHLVDRFIPDDQVHLYFSAADLCVLPYRSATQSGVTATAFHFGIPALVTDVGGLKDAVGSKGIAVKANDHLALAEGIASVFQEDVLEHFQRAIASERTLFSWEYFTKELVQFAQELPSTP